MGKHVGFLIVTYFLLGLGGAIAPQAPAPGPSPVPTPEAITISQSNGSSLDLYPDGSYALVIGNSDYQYWPKLPGAAADVDPVAQILTDQGFIVQRERNLTGERLKSIIDKFIREHAFARKRRILIYFAGHGATVKGDGDRSIGYIVPVDAPPVQNDGFMQTAIQFDDVEAWAKKIQSRHALFVFDSCFSGNLLRRSDNTAPPYIEEKLAGSVRQFFTSGSEKEQVFDQGYFRQQFVDGLKGKADLDGNTYITASELALYLQSSISDYSRRAQNPQFGAINEPGLDRGDMVFRVPISMRIENYKKATEKYAGVEKNNVNDLLSFARQHPDTPEARDARQRLTVLKGGQDQTRGGAADAKDSGSIPALIFQTMEFATAEINGNGLETKSRKSSTIFHETIGGVKFRMVKIPAGEFEMGSPEQENEKPVHKVSIPEFYIGAYEVTQALWKVVASSKRINIDLAIRVSSRQDDDLPVESVTWEEAVEFCARLSRETGRTYALPSEAEWEYAARGGTKGPFAFGFRLSSNVANYDALNGSPNRFTILGSDRKETVPVGGLGFANPFGLYDVHGNVAEWCSDSWNSNHQGAPSDGSSRINAFFRKVVRGGSWKSTAGDARSSFRTQMNKDEKYDAVGFRVVLRTAPN